MNDEPADRFDQCEVYSGQNGERCTKEAGHDPPHSFDFRREIHDYFELSYANWLTLPRTLLQSMPSDWQKDFVELLDKFDEEMGWAMHLIPATNVQVLKRSPEMIEEREECENCEGSGEDENEEDGLCHECDSMGDISTGEERYETPEEVGEIHSPIPHYQRGRIRVPMASDDPKDVENSHMELKRQWLKANHIDLFRKYLGPEYHDGQVVNVIRAKVYGEHVLPPVLAEAPGLGYFVGKILSVVPKSDNSLYKVMILNEHGIERPVEVQLHADQIRKVGHAE